MTIFSRAGYCRKVFFSVLTATSLAFAAQAVQAQDIKPRVIRFAHGLADNSPTGKVALQFAEEIKTASGGKMKVKTYGNTTLGADDHLRDSLIGGTVEMAFISTAPLANIVKGFGVFDLPFLFDNEDVAYAVLDGAEGQKLLDTLPEKGIVGLRYWENGFRNITNSRHEIKTLEDLNGIKLRVMQNQVALNVFNGLGANAIPMPFSELFTALETKTVDGQENPLSIIVTSKFFEVQPFVTISNHVYTPYVLVVSKKWWDKLSQDEKAIIETAVQKYQAIQRQASRDGNAEYIQFLQDNGVKVTQLPVEEKERMLQHIEPILASLKGDIGAETVDGIQAAAAKAAQQ